MTQAAGLGLSLNTYSGPAAYTSQSVSASATNSVWGGMRDHLDNAIRLALGHLREKTDHVLDNVFRVGVPALGEKLQNTFTLSAIRDNIAGRFSGSVSYDKDFVAKAPEVGAPVQAQVKAPSISVVAQQHSKAVENLQSAFAKAGASTGKAAEQGVQMSNQALCTISASTAQAADKAVAGIARLVTGGRAA